MAEELPVRRVEVTFVGAAPAQRVERASGVSEVEIDGSLLRCLVCGSFQPFLEALRGHEVVGFSSAATVAVATVAVAVVATTGTTGTTGVPSD
jgi:hypothetical protein